MHLLVLQLQLYATEIPSEGSEGSEKSDGNEHNKLLISVLISAFVIVSKLFSRAKADPSAGLILYKIEWHA